MGYCVTVQGCNKKVYTRDIICLAGFGRMINGSKGAGSLKLVYRARPILFTSKEDGSSSID